jgi:hypothetical protein
MPKINLGDVSGAEDFAPLPFGTYPCRLSQVDLAETRSGHEKWKLTWVVASGSHKGRRIFDQVSFSDAAMPRVKCLCDALGIDTGGEINLEIDMVGGRYARVTVEIGEYEDEAGVRKKINRVTWGGYSPIRPGDVETEDVPF